MNVLKKLSYTEFKKLKFYRSVAQLQRNIQDELCKGRCLDVRPPMKQD